MDIEKEVQARVSFKMNEFLTGMQNRIKNHYNMAFLNVDNTQLSQKQMHYNEAFKLFTDAFIKERDMPVPYDNMYNESKRNARDQAVSTIMSHPCVRSHESDRRGFISTVVSAVEQSQNF